MRLAVSLLALIVAGQPRPAALAVDARTCGAYVDGYTLVRQDVLATMNDAEKNLPRAEDSLRKTQEDLRSLKAAAEDLGRQKTVLLDHIARLESVIGQQQRACEPGVSDQVAGAWEWLDAPLAFAAGAGVCVGLAWGLNEVSR